MPIFSVTSKNVYLHTVSFSSLTFCSSLTLLSLQLIELKLVFCFFIRTISTSMADDNTNNQYIYGRRQYDQSVHLWQTTIRPISTSMADDNTNNQYIYGRRQYEQSVHLWQTTIPKERLTENEIESDSETKEYDQSVHLWQQTIQKESFNISVNRKRNRTWH
jgi:hypothetical protein